uniref:Uncharacterized protein n=1 Tax=Meloidogyne enterolobii TaxID=390850 RepID=A0A6V7VNN9_MELEN|nr:unnamed protein product [Meloidogyne enterolobii]
MNKILIIFAIISLSSFALMQVDAWWPYYGYGYAGYYPYYGAGNVKQDSRTIYQISRQMGM